MDDPNFGYWNAVTDARSLGIDFEDSFEGQTLISIETVADENEASTYEYVREHFREFLEAIHFLPPFYRELLIGYFVLNKTQSTLAKIHGSVQTHISTHLRMATRLWMCLLLYKGIPTEEQMRPVMQKAKCERVKMQLAKRTQRSKHFGIMSLAALMAEYARCRSDKETAKKFQLHRPDIHRVLSVYGHQLLEGRGEEQAVGAYIMHMLHLCGYPKPHKWLSGEPETLVMKTHDKLVPLTAPDRIRLEDTKLLEELFQPSALQD